jgi:membrane protein DedA with SNARE-associated domain
MSWEIDPAAIVSLLVFVAFGAIVPVVPTGAAVSAAAVVAAHQSVPSLITVVAAGAVGAYVGDGVTYGILRVGRQGAAKRMPWLHTNGVSQRTADRLAARPIQVLLVSRLIPGGRVPVLFAAALFRVPWRHFAVANAAAALLWSVVYASIGLLGSAIFPEPWQGIVAAVAIVLVISLVGDRVRLWRESRAQA